MKKPTPFRKIDEYGNIITEAFETYPAQEPVEQSEEAGGPQLLKDEDDIEEEDIDIESDDDTLNSAVNDDDYEIETTTNSTMQVVSLEDVLSLLKQVQGETAAAKPATTVADTAGETVAQDATAVPTSESLQGGEDALKRVYFQAEGNEILDSEFEFSNESAQSLEGKVDEQETYIDSIDGLPKAYADFDDVAQAGAARPKVSHIGVQGGTTTYDDMDGGEECNPDMERLNKKDVELDGTQDCNPDDLLLDGEGEPEPEELDENELLEMFGELEGLDEEEEIDECNTLKEEDAIYEGEPDELPSWVKEFMLANGLDPEDAYNYKPKKEQELNEIDEEPELVYSAEYDEDQANPDLLRIAGPIDPAEDDNEFEVPDVEEYEEIPEPAGPAPVTTDTTMNVGGTPIKIILTGVVITEGEIKYISESVKGAGNKLKAIKGEGNKLQIVVEANSKQYTINYVDAPKVKEPAPFSVKKYKFGSLEEALGRINHNNVPKTQEVFKSIISESIASRSINEFKEADIFEGLNENVSYIGTWTMKAVGTVNLKNGLNEVYSNIIQHGKEPNTLVKTNEGAYYLIKGNLRERSKVGIRKELVDMSGKKSYGIAEVVGVYDNTSAGLGKIMEKIRRTSLPLLAWK